MNRINVVSLCDGISCLRLSLEELGYKIGNYYSSEIDKSANSISRFNYENIEIGDVTKVTEEMVKDFGSIDIIGFGSPCQSFSKLGNGNGFEGKSGLFYDCMKVTRWVKRYNPNVKVLVENVVMKKEWEDEITKCLKIVFDDIEVTKLNSKDFSVQNT